MQHRNIKRNTWTIHSIFVLRCVLYVQPSWADPPKDPLIQTMIIIKLIMYSRTYFSFILLFIHIFSSSSFLQENDEGIWGIRLRWYLFSLVYTYILLQEESKSLCCIFEIARAFLGFHMVLPYVPKTTTLLGATTTYIVMARWECWWRGDFTQDLIDCCRQQSMGLFPSEAEQAINSRELYWMSLKSAVPHLGIPQSRNTKQIIAFDVSRNEFYDEMWLLSILIQV